MICLKEATISNKLAPKKNVVSLSYISGFHQLEKDEQYIFDFLGLQRQDLDKGEFLIDGVKILPDEDENKSVFFLKINSQNIVLSVCYLFANKYRKENVDSLLSSLQDLKDMEISTAEGKKAKVDAIIQTVIRFRPSYVLLDTNNEINYQNKELVFSSLLSRQNELLIFSSFEEERPVETVIEATPVANDIKIVKNASKVDEKPIEKKNENTIKTPKVKTDIKTSFINIAKSFGKHSWKFIKNYYLLLLFDLFCSALCLLFALDAPYLLSLENKASGIVQLVGSIIILLLEVFIQFTFSDFHFKKKENNTEFFYSLGYQLFVILCGFGVGVGLFYLASNFIFGVKLNEYVFSQSILGIIFSIICFVVPIIIAFTHEYVFAFFRLFKNKEARANAKVKLKNGFATFKAETKEVFKTSYMLYLFDFVCTALCLAFALNTPYLFAQENKSVAIVQLVGAIIILLLVTFIQIVFNDYSYSLKKKNTRFLYFLSWRTVFYILGIGLGIGVFFIAAGFNFGVKLSEYNMSFAYLGFIFGALAFVLPTIISFVNPLIYKLKNKLFPKKSK